MKREIVRCCLCRKKHKKLLGARADVPFNSLDYGCMYVSLPLPMCKKCMELFECIVYGEERER